VLYGGAAKPGSVGAILGEPVKAMMTKTGKIPPWQLALFVILVAAIIFGFQALFGRDDATTPPVVGTEVKAVVSNIVSFDPTADGGSGDECDETVANAIDGNPATIWDCNYYDSAIPSMKPGFGLLLTLTKEELVTAVGSQVPDAGSVVKIMVPDTDKFSPDGTVPVDSVTSWHEIGGGQIVGTTARFILTEPVKAKYILVYATQLADVGNWQFEFAVSEVTVYARG
jgi:hypothetical protein